MRKILIVEDDQLVANIYANRFSREGFQVKIAADGEAGLRLFHSFRPDAVILDLMLPKLSGVELTKRIRAEAGRDELPVIVFSNAYQTSMMHQAEKAGATACLSKATSMPKQVVELVRRLLPADAPPAVAPNSSADLIMPARTLPASPKAVVGSMPATSGDPGVAFPAELRKSFIERLPATLAILRALLQRLITADDEPVRLVQIRELYRQVRTLTGSAHVADMPQVARLSDALEALLSALSEKPKSITASPLRTIAVAVDFLGILSEQRCASVKLENPPPNVLVVDDETISARAVTCALDKAKLKSVTVKDPAAAYDLLAKDRFDLIFLDVDMPGVSGYELCTKLRMLPEHKHTPVVFVTCLDDFDSRANSTVCGGSDFIAKPFLFIELAVKALVYVYRNRLQFVK
jgi:DNA-binding response OmpR family regulator